jgi:DNA-binding MarR family transcriptional regulator
MPPNHSDAQPFYAIPTLMRAARGAYAQAIRAELDSLGIADLPRNGAFVLARIYETGGPRAELTEGLGVSKQAVSQVVDILVGRGLVARREVPGDRRRVDLALTAPGEEVLHAVARAVADTDLQLEERLSPEKVQTLREALTTLAGMKLEGRALGSGRRRPGRQLRSASPIFSVRDLGAALDHYRALGFATNAYEGAGDYGFADREGVGLHFIRTTEEPVHRGMAYLYVADADALFAEWSRPGTGGATFAPAPTEYGLLEGRHVDPDGNVLRFGSPIEEDE